MNRCRTILETEAITVRRWDHPEGEPHDDPAEEESPGFALAFVERGRFEVRRGRRRWQLHPGTVFVQWPDLTYRCRHDDGPASDVCLSVVFSPRLVEDVARTAGRKWRPREPQRPLTNRLAYLKTLLIRAVQDPAMAAESAGGELLAALSESGAGSPHLYRDAQLAWYVARVDAARHTLGMHFDEPLTLGQLARAAGMSPFHFARVFGELTGVPPHRYLMRTRLAHAAARLRDGETVTRASMAAGFGNLSHFSRSFRRAFGVSPSLFGRS